MKRNRTADAWKSLVMIGSLGKMGRPSHRTVIIQRRSVQLPGSAFSTRNNTPRLNTPYWASCVLWTPSRPVKISAWHASTRGSQVLRLVPDRQYFAHFARCRYQHSRLEAEDIPRGHASDAHSAHRGCGVSRSDGPRPGYKWMPLDSPRRWTGPPPPKGRLARRRVRDVEQSRSPYYEVTFHECPPFKDIPTDCPD